MILTPDQQLRVFISSTMRERKEKNLRRLEAELGHDAFERAWSAGTGLTVEEAVAEASSAAPAAAPAGPQP